MTGESVSVTGALSLLTHHSFQLLAWGDSEIGALPVSLLKDNAACNVRFHIALVDIPDFVDPVGGVHRQNVEFYWNRVKMKFKRMRSSVTAAVTPFNACSYCVKWEWSARGHGSRIVKMPFQKHTLGYLSCSTVAIDLCGFAMQLR